MVQSRTFFVLILATAISSAAEAAVEAGDLRFAPQVEAGSEKLAIRGAGVLRWRSIVPAYAAALYLPAEVAGTSALADVPKRLEIQFFRAIEASAFGRAAEVLLERQVSPQTLAALAARIRDLHDRYESIEPGERYALTYLPGVGTELAKNGRRLAVIPGSDFAAAYFAIWLGDDPIDPRLRDELRNGKTAARP